MFRISISLSYVDLSQISWIYLNFNWGNFSNIMSICLISEVDIYQISRIYLNFRSGYFSNVFSTWVFCSEVDISQIWCHLCGDCDVREDLFDIYCQHFSRDELRYFPSNISILILTMSCGGICKAKSNVAVTYSRCPMDLWSPKTQPRY